MKRIIGKISFIDLDYRHIALSEVRSQRSEVRSQKSEVRSQRSEVRGNKKIKQ